MRRRTRRAEAALEAAEAAARESSRRAEVDAAQALRARRVSQELAAKIQAYNEANGFASWIFDDLAGGPA